MKLYACSEKYLRDWATDDGEAARQLLNGYLVVNYYCLATFESAGNSKLHLKNIFSKAWQLWNLKSWSDFKNVSSYFFF